MRKLPVILAAVALILVSASAATRSPKGDIARGLDIFTAVYKNLQTSYVDTVDAEKSINTAIAAMLDEIDPYTEYIPESEQQDFRSISTGEYGGIGMVVDGHIWTPDRNWGYIQFKSPGEVTDKYVEYANELARLAKAGFTGAVYTQTTDVEMEVNGLMTYDRKVIKVDEDRVARANRAVCESLNK